MEHNILAKKFNFVSLIRFAFPNIIMMIFLSMYTIVDGIFISRYAGTLALSAVNMSYPLNCLEMAVGIMFATGGSAVIARRLGEGKSKKAKENFTFLVGISFLVGILFMVLGNLFLDELLYLLGTSEKQFALCKSYTQVLVSFSPAFFLQTAFQILFVTAGKPKLGLLVTVLAGVVNMVLDYIFMAVLHLGIAGAAWATGIGYMIPAAAGLLYFSFNRKGILHFTAWKSDWRMLLKASGNGSSEMVTNIANATTTFLFNMLFMKYYGEDGVAAITIALYFQFVFSAIFFGFSMGISPVISFKYGAKDYAQMKKIVCSGLVFMGFCSIVSCVIAVFVVRPALSIFTETGSNVYNITLEGFGIYAVSFLLMGISIYASAMFTALSDGKSSAIISFARTFVFLAGMLLILPAAVGKMGIWLAVPVAEGLGLIVAVCYLIRKRRVYHY